MIRFLLLILLISSTPSKGFTQGMRFEYNNLTKESGFKIEGYRIWGGSMIKVGKVTIHKIGDEYVLFFIRSDFTTTGDNPKSLLRRVGYASAKKIEGPWKRADQPLINTESNNPDLSRQYRFAPCKKGTTSIADHK
jgi:hypothetical protein